MELIMNEREINLNVATFIEIVTISCKMPRIKRAFKNLQIGQPNKPV